MKTDMLRYAATTVAYVADYGTLRRVDMGNVGLKVSLVRAEKGANLKPYSHTPGSAYGLLRHFRHLVTDRVFPGKVLDFIKSGGPGSGTRTP